MSEKENQEEKELIKERFGKYSQAYVKSVHHGNSKDLDRIVELINPQKDWQMLDIATGGGHTALKFAPYVNSVIASDITPNMLQQAEKFIREQGVQNVKFRIADAESLPFNTEQFDLVTCRIAPHHFTNIEKFLKEVNRILKPKGKFILIDQVASEEKDVQDYINRFEKIRDPSHHKTLSKTEWFTYAKESSLRIEYHEFYSKEINFNWWVGVQECSSKVIKELNDLLTNAPLRVKTQMQMQKITTPDCSFLIHFIILILIKMI